MKIKKSYLITGIIVVLGIIGAVYYIQTNSNASAETSAQRTLRERTPDLSILIGDTYKPFKKVMALQKAQGASSNTFIRVGDEIYSTDGKKHLATDQVVPSTNQIKILTNNGSFYIAFREPTTSISQLEETNRTTLFAYKGDLYYRMTSPYTFPQEGDVRFSGGEIFVRTQNSNIEIDVRGLAKYIQVGTISQ